MTRYQHGFYKFFLSEIGINSYNINGIWKRINSFRYNKVNDPFFQSTEDACLHIDGYKCFNICRPKGKKASGGLAVYVHNSIKAGVAKMPLAGTESIIIKLRKDFFGLKKDIFICFAYCVPHNSPILGEKFMPSDIFEDLEQKLALYAGQGDTILLGDMNSRTLNMPDFLTDDDSQYLPTPPPELYQTEGLGLKPGKTWILAITPMVLNFWSFVKKSPLEF